MGCSLSQDRLVVDITSLSLKDKELIRKSWAMIPNTDELGNQIMFRIFKTHDEIKYLWIFASNLETESEMLNNSQFCYHAKRLGDSLNSVVNALTESTSEVDFTNHIDMFGLGKRHHHYGVQEDYCQCFEECLIYALKKCISDRKCFNNETKRAWRNAIEIMFHHFGGGLNSEEKESKAQERLKTKLKLNTNMY